MIKILLIKIFKKLFFLVVFMLLFTTILLAQKSGEVKGVIKDSLKNNVLAKATIFIFDNTDSTIINTVLSDINGEFVINKIPNNIPLKLIITYIGYKKFEQNFTIDLKQPIKNLGVIKMFASNNILESVTVKASLPAIVMNKDTLEFNANAYKVSATGQTEDLLKILPGVRVDEKGNIFYNGKKVKKVLVNGKPFFSDDAKIATQNIPKDIVNKVQVYNTGDSKTELTDSVPEINIKLKKGKNIGYFGKISTAFGTTYLNENDASINFFNAKTQVSLAVAQNNTNKSLGNIGNILANSTFKDNIENYDVNFGEGINNYKAGGINIAHDLTTAKNPDKSSRINASYFIENKNKLMAKNMQNTTLINDTSNFTQQELTNAKDNELVHTANLSYQYNNTNSSASVSTSFSNSTLTNNSSNEIKSADKNNEALSNNKNISFKNTNNTLGGISVNYNHNNLKKRTLFSYYDLSYNFNTQNSKANTEMGIEFTAFKNINENKKYNRSIKTISNNTTHNIGFNIPMIDKIWAPNKTFGIEINFNSNLNFINNKVDNRVIDTDTISQITQPNSYLTNTLKQNSSDVNSGFNFKKRFEKIDSLTTKIFSIESMLMGQMYSQKTIPTKAIQQLSNTFSNLIPSIGFTYIKNYTGKYFNYFSANFSKGYTYPTIDQLVQLSDSTNQNYVLAGNAGLKEQANYNTLFSFNHNSDGIINSFGYSFIIEFSGIKKAIVLNTKTDSLGRVNAIYINANGGNGFNIGVGINKGYTIKKSQFYLSLTPSFAINQQPNVVNNIINISKTITQIYATNISYSYNNKLNVNLNKSLTFASQSQNEIASQVFKTVNSAINLNCIYQISDKLFVNSNAVYTNNTINKLTVNNFTIWNAAVGYRFLKSNNLSVKLTAFDILKQNTSLMNMVTNNTISVGTQNTLQQYFLITLAYFPRKFGIGSD
jgi:CarboxypepD_reg-like domain